MKEAEREVYECRYVFSLGSMVATSVILGIAIYDLVPCWPLVLVFFWWTVSAIYCRTRLALHS